ncbi:MAG: ATP-dependent Clp protease adaptor ClpS [Cytophagales bacterium]
MKANPFYEEDVLLEEQVIDQKEYDLIVYNDDVNTFEHVIDTLIDVCSHSEHQAEQCTIIIHFKGKCAVKKGDFDTLAPMRNDICRRGIQAEVI